MNPLRLVWLFATCLLTAALGAPTRDEALQAIGTLEEGVFSENALAAAGVIVRFAETSEDVRFMLGPDTAPWITEKHDKNDFEDAARSLLLAVYFAGNAKAQLVRGAKPRRDARSTRATNQLGSSNPKLSGIVVDAIGRLYSARSNRVISTFAARRAGSQDAAAAAMSNTPATAA